MVCWLGLFRAEEILASSLLAAIAEQPHAAPRVQETVYKIHKAIDRLHVLAISALPCSDYQKGLESQSGSESHNGETKDLLHIRSTIS